MGNVFGLSIGLTLAVVVYYGAVTKVAVPLSSSLARASRLGRRHAFGELDAVARLLLAGAGQLAFCWLLLGATGTDWRRVGFATVTPLHVVYGVLLGLGEMALGSFLGYVGVRTAMVLAPSRVPAELRGWLTVAKGGWMRELLSTAEITPIPVAFGLIGLYVAVEETIFRGVIISSMGHYSPLFALVLSIFLFAIVQIINMPGFVNGIFPLIGAILVGTVHGIIYLTDSDLIPLVIAHFVFFVAAVVL